MMPTRSVHFSIFFLSLSLSPLSLSLFAQTLTKVKFMQSLNRSRRAKNEQKNQICNHTHENCDKSFLIIFRILYFYYDNNTDRAGYRFIDEIAPVRLVDINPSIDLLTFCFAHRNEYAFFFMCLF